MYFSTGFILLFITCLNFFHLVNSSKVLGILYKGVSEEDKYVILKKHHDLRESLVNGLVPGQPRALEMATLKWDDRLAKKAQKIANQCEFRHKKIKDGRWKHIGNNLGINISNKYTKKFDWDNIIQSWFDEYEKYHFSDSFTPGTGHYTQVIWGNTNRIGCGAVIYLTDDKMYHKLYVCYYGPGGNVVGQFPYKTDFIDEKTNFIEEKINKKLQEKEDYVFNKIQEKTFKFKNNFFDFKK